MNLDKLQEIANPRSEDAIKKAEDAVKWITDVNIEIVEL